MNAAQGLPSGRCRTGHRVQRAWRASSNGNAAVAMLVDANHPPVVAEAPGRRRSAYLVALTWGFAFFNTVRALAYLPTILTIAHLGNSTQHSLWTWMTWLGANVTMAAWLYEHNGMKLNKAVAVNVANAAMCLVTVAVIVAFRI